MTEERRNRRLSIEAERAQSCDYEGIKFCPVGDSLDTWKATFEGPEDSVYHGTTIEVNIDIPKAYPYEPPTMHTDILHPNVYARNGEVCMSILHQGKDKTGYEKIAERWLPGKSISACVLGFQQILSDPNFESPANIEVAFQLKRDPELLKSRIMNAFIRKSQDRAFDKCEEVDRKNAEKRKVEMLQDSDEELQNSKKIEKAGEEQNHLIPLPEEPESGGALIKFKTNKGNLQRTFDIKNKIISAFNFLSNSGIDAENITIPGTPRTVIDREKAELSTFENVNIKSGITLFVCEKEEE